MTNATMASVMQFACEDLVADVDQLQRQRALCFAFVRAFEFVPLAVQRLGVDAIHDATDLFGDRRGAVVVRVSILPITNEIAKRFRL